MKRVKKRDVVLAAGGACFVYGLLLTNPWLLLSLFGCLLIGWWWVTE